MEGLAEYGAKLRQAEMRRQTTLRDQRAAVADFRKLIEEGIALGLSRAEIGRQAGVSSETIYRILRKG